MHPHIQDVLKGKRLLVYKEMLQAVGFPDEHLFHDIIEGFRLTGWMRDSGCFLKIPRPPTLTLEALWRLNRGLQESVLKRVKDQALDDTSKEAWEETEKELQKGWIWEDAAVNLCGKVIAHRFGLAQKTKVRVIDNFKQCGLNETCGLPERYVLHGVDYIAATLVRSLALAGSDNGLKLEGKTFDLTSAYKQYPIHSDDRNFVRIALKDPALGQCRVFGVNALPFGATGSVAGFLRVSLSIFYILTKGMQVWASAFFDDFPTLSLQTHSSLTDLQVAALFDLLGISFAKEGKKKTEFGSRMKALGLIFDLEDFGKGRVFIRHTDERKAELLARIDEILSDNSLTPKEAESLRGRMHWYESYLFGRTANLAVHQLGKRISGPPWIKQLDEELKSALVLLRDRVLNGPPVTLTAATETPLVIFTDGACESEGGSVGGILYCGSCEPLRYFSSKVPDLLLREFSTEAQHPIFLVELLACYLAIFLWGPEAVGRYVVLYLDNEAAKGAIIKGYSSTQLGNALVKLTISAEESSQWKTWYGRVPTSSNTADAPSRFDNDALEQSNAIFDDIPWDQIIYQFQLQQHVLVGWWRVLLALWFNQASFHLVCRGLTWQNQFTSKNQHRESPQLLNEKKWRFKWTLEAVVVIWCSPFYKFYKALNTKRARSVACATFFIKAVVSQQAVCWGISVHSRRDGNFIPLAKIFVLFWKTPKISLLARALLRILTFWIFDQQTFLKQIRNQPWNQFKGCEVCLVNPPSSLLWL